MTGKEKIEYLIYEYNNGKYTMNDFCDLYTSTFNFEVAQSDYSDEVYSQLERLMRITSRYSSFVEDHKIDPKAFTNDEDVKKALADIDKVQIKFNAEQV